MKEEYIGTKERAVEKSGGMFGIFPSRGSRDTSIPSQRRPATCYVLLFLCDIRSWSGVGQALEPFKTTSSYVQHVLIITAIWRRHCRRGQQSNKSTIKLQPVLSVFNERGNLRRVRLRLEKFNRVGKSTSVVAGAPSWASKLPICCSTKELSD